MGMNTGTGALGCAACCCFCLCLGFSLPMMNNVDYHTSSGSVSYTYAQTQGLWGTFTWSTYDGPQISGLTPSATESGYTSNGFADCNSNYLNGDNVDCWLLTTQRLYTATFAFAMLALFASAAGMMMKMVHFVGALLHFLTALGALSTVSYFTSKYSDSWGSSNHQDTYPSFSYVVLWFAVIGHLCACGASVMAALAKDGPDPADLEPATEEIGTEAAVTAKV